MFKILSYPIKDGDPTWPGNPTCSLNLILPLQKEIPQIRLLSIFLITTVLIWTALCTLIQMVFLWTKFPWNVSSIRNLFVIDVPKKAGEKILTEDLIPYKDQIAQADFLFLRTGFWKKRKSDPSVYENNGPAVGSAAKNLFT